MTKIESLIFAHPKYAALRYSEDWKEKQKIIDEITDEVLIKVSDLDICLYTQEVYNETVSEYVATPHNQGIVDELVIFMNKLPPAAKVLDVGCGAGRDVLFMSVPDENYRREQMHRITNGKTTLEKFPVPTKTFFVTGIDISLQMLMRAHVEAEELRERGLLMLSEESVCEYKFLFEYPVFIGRDMHHIDSSLGLFDGIWSCTALFVHTPKRLLASAMNSVAGSLNKGGIFCVSYINGRAVGHYRYDKLQLSSTGRIKYFSQPDPDEIIDLADRCSLHLESELFNDFEVQGKIIKENLFVTQFFKKL